MSTFEARYHSRCPACDELIRPGDPVKWDDDAVIHVDCEALAPDEPAEACPACFMVPSLTGACGCDS